MDFDNLEDFYEYVQENTKEAIRECNEGEIADISCPYCKKETKGKMLKDGNIECQSCKNVVITEKKGIISD
ncbi:hypothetical protein AL713_15955 [Clostridium botulinum]|uniref:hypothetical protein n=1 Tax=Clostridium botulinum TaxID=1491 RepID=UPI00099C1182|nr:hypothetical protein [Clostridium botulinum]OPD29595.1 hypothetical protein AL713_15955 [Clostridium botulinum]HCL4559286.1 hypothetical protein [Clostridium botulinum]HCL4570058.1 hypothetical protein [Clostridium botulinum]HCL4584874.1 hypothetical protein [Clostridium botulinum]